MSAEKGIEILERFDKFIKLMEETADEKKILLDKIIIMLNQIIDIIDQNEIRAQRTEIDKKLIESVQKARKDNKINKRKGSIRIGRVASLHERGRKFPITYGYLNVSVISSNKTKLGSECSPFVLKDGFGRIHENVWQFSKIYRRISEQRQKNGWSWPTSKFLKTSLISKENITDDYWKWREAGMKFDHYLRYPVGMEEKNLCKGVLFPKDFEDDPDNLYKEINNPDTEFEVLDIVESRRKVYTYLYMKLVKQTSDFKALKKLIDNGTNIQILEVDVAQKECGVPILDGCYGEDKVGSFEINEENITTTLNNKSFSFGHGYALCCLLLDHPEWCTTEKLAAHLKD